MDVPLAIESILNDPIPSTSAGRDWRDITRRMASGDLRAFEIFYQQNFDLMLATVRQAIGRDEASSLDVVQEAMLKAIRCIKPLPDEAAVRAWSRAVAKSVAFDWLRSELKRNRVEQAQPPRDSREDSNLDDDDSPERLVWIEEQLQSFPTEFQDLIAFRYRLGWSLRMISEKLGIKTGAVDGKIRRGVEKLKERARREFDE